MRKLPALLLMAAVAAATALPAAPALADPPPWAPAHGYRAKQYRYVYYPAYQAYYAPETQLWFWFGGGQWRTGVTLPTGLAVAGAPGFSVVLDTGRPYERHDYVIERYGRDDWDRPHRHEKHRKHHHHDD